MERFIYNFFSKWRSVKSYFSNQNIRLPNFPKCILVLLLEIYSFNARAQSPSISDFIPTSGPVGTTITINGTNFSATPANNIVYFGATKATVTAATSTQLSVTVPIGATYKPISVQVAGLAAYSQSPFLVTFGGGGTINTCAFNPVVNFPLGATPYDVLLGDLDGDGKSDMIAANFNSRTVSVYRNISSTGGTPREKEILSLLSQGNSYKIIASQYDISLDTVRTHIKKIYEKLHVHSQTEAVSKAINEKLV